MAPGAYPALDGLAERMHASARAGHASNTNKVYDRHIIRWQSFCAAHGLSEFNSVPDLAGMFLTMLREEGDERRVGPQAVTQASAAIGAHFRRAGLPSPFDSPICATVRQVALRTMTAEPRDRAAVDAADVRALVRRHINPACDLRTRMHVTCMVLCYAGQLRFDDLGHVMVHYDLLRIYGDRAEIYLWRSKTDPQAAGAWVTVARVGGECCPVQLLTDLLAAGSYRTEPATATVGGEAQEVEDVGPLLRPLVKWGNAWALERVAAPITEPIAPTPYAAFRRHMLQLLKEAGIEKPVGTHSFRIGGTTAAVNNGVEPTLVQKAGRWRSATVFQAKYVRDGVPRRLAVTQGMGLAN